MWAMIEKFRICILLRKASAIILVEMVGSHKWGLFAEKTVMDLEILKCGGVTLDDA